MGALVGLDIAARSANVAGGTREPAGRMTDDEARITAAGGMEDDASDGAPNRISGAAGAEDSGARVVYLDGVAFILNRVTGLALVAYLYLHLMILSMLVRGPSAWDDFVDVALSPPFLALDVFLLTGVLIHGLNGIRVGLVGLGLVASRRRALLLAAVVIGAFVALAGALRIFAAE